MSPVINPDTSLAEDFREPIEPGIYRARIVDAEVGKSKAGNQKVVPKFEIDVNGKKRTRVAHLVTTGEGTIGFDHLLRACHMEKLADAYFDKSVSPKPPFDTDSLRGQELMVKIEPNLYTNPDTKVEEKRDQIVDFLKV